MILPSSLDLEQFKENGEWTETSSKKLKNYADSYFSAMAEVRPAIFAGVCAMKGRINEKLSEKRSAAYEDIVKLIRGQEYENLAQYDYDLKVFQTAVKIYETEKVTGNTLFDHVTYTEEFEQIYRSMNLYLRRVQLGLSKDLLDEMMLFVQSNQVSVYAMVEYIKASSVGSKPKVCERVASLYAARGYYKEALYLVTTAIDYPGLPEEQLFTLTERKEYYKSKI